MLVQHVGLSTLSLFLCVLTKGRTFHWTVFGSLRKCAGGCRCRCRCLTREVWWRPIFSHSFSLIQRLIDSCSAAAAAEVEAESEAQHFSLLFHFDRHSDWKKQQQQQLSSSLCLEEEEEEDVPRALPSLSSELSSAQRSDRTLSSRQQTERTRGSSALVGAAVGRASSAQSIRYRSVRSSQRASVCSRGPKMFASAFACLPPLLSPTTTTSAVVFTLQSLIPPERSLVHVARSHQHQPPAANVFLIEWLLSPALFSFSSWCVPSPPSTSSSSFSLATRTSNTSTSSSKTTLSVGRIKQQQQQLSVGATTRDQVSKSTKCPIPIHRDTDTHCWPTLTLLQF